jgi:hypothetical protein
MLPGESRLYRIEPATSYLVGNASDLTSNNGRRLEYNGTYHATFRNGTHVYYTHCDPTGDGTEPLTAFAVETKLDSIVDSANHPSIRSIGTTLGVVYEGRKNNKTWIMLAMHQHNGVDTTGITWQRVIVDTFSTANSFESFPVIAPFNKVFHSNLTTPPGLFDSTKGFVVSWGKASQGICSRTYAFDNKAGSPVLGDTVMVHAGGSAYPSSHPTLSDRGIPNANDTVDLGFDETAPGGSDIWYRPVFLQEQLYNSNTAYKINLVPSPAETLSYNIIGGCSNLHPNIDDAHTMPYGFAPRVVWEGDEAIDGRGWVTSIYSAVRINGTWQNIMVIRSKEQALLHPSVRVFNTDSVLVHRCKDCGVIWSVNGTMLKKAPIDPSRDTLVWVPNNQQPTKITFYSTSHRLGLVSAQDG